MRDWGPKAAENRREDFDDIADLLKHWAAVDNRSFFASLLTQKCGFQWTCGERVCDVPKIESRYGLDVWLALYGPMQVGKSCFVGASGSLRCARPGFAVYERRKNGEDTKNEGFIPDWANGKDPDRTGAHLHWLARSYADDEKDLILQFFDIGGELLQQTGVTWLEGVPLVVNELRPLSVLLMFMSGSPPDVHVDDECVRIVKELVASGADHSIPIYILFNQSDKRLVGTSIDLTGALRDVFEGKAGPFFAPKEQDSAAARDGALLPFLALREINGQYNGQHTRAVNLVARSRTVCKNLAFAQLLRGDLDNVQRILFELLKKGFWNISFLYTCCKPKTNQLEGVRLLWSDLTGWLKAQRATAAHGI